ncbi:MAG: hypothetical protein H0V43_07170, partial [Gemmatimonadales bacterium]|nr:hypothetical protein [Gemmatimonadales bacterium]
MARSELIVGIGADTSDLQQEIRRAAQDIGSLGDQFAALAPDVDTSGFLEGVIAGVREAGDEMGVTAEQARIVEQLLAEIGAGGSRGATGLDALAASSRAAVAQQSQLAAQAEDATAAVGKLLAVTATPAPAPTPPDLTEWIQVADQVRGEFNTIISANQIGQRAAAAARQGADALQAGFLGRLGELRDLLATGLISPRDFARQADVALEAFSREIIAQGARLPKITIRARVATEGPNLISADELQEAEDAYQRLTQETAGAATASQQYARQTGRTTDQVQQGARAATLMRTSLVGLAGQALGTSGAMGQLAQSVFFFAGGVGKIAAAAGAVLVVAKAFEYLTTQSRELKEAEEERVKSLTQQVEQAIPSAVKAEQALTAALNAQARAREELIQLEFAKGTTGLGLGPALAPFYTEAQRQQAEKLKVAEQAEGQARKNSIAGIREEQDVEVRALTESIELGVARNFQLQQAATYLK